MSFVAGNILAVGVVMAASGARVLVCFAFAAGYQLGVVPQLGAGH